MYILTQWRIKNKSVVAAVSMRKQMCIYSVHAVCWTYAYVVSSKYTHKKCTTMYNSTT